MNIKKKVFLVLLLFSFKISASIWRPSDGVSTYSRLSNISPQNITYRQAYEAETFWASLGIGMIISVICEKIYNFIQNKIFLSSFDKYQKPQNIFYSENELSKVNTASEIIRKRLPLPGKILVAHNEGQASNGVTTCILSIAAKSSAGIIYLSSMLDPKINEIRSLASQYVSFKSKPLIIFLDNLNESAEHCNRALVSKSIAAIESATNVYGVYFAIGTNTFNSIKNIFLNEGRPGFEIKMENPTSENIQNMLHSTLPKNTSPQRICQLTSTADGLCRATIINSIIDSATSIILKSSKKYCFSRKKSTKKLIEMAAAGKNSDEFYDRLLICMKSKQKKEEGFSTCQETSKPKSIFYELGPIA
jgi:hypothetical protein